MLARHDVMTSLAATKQPISVPQADANSIKGEHSSKKVHSMRRERICRISYIDQEYPSL